MPEATPSRRDLGRAFAAFGLTGAAAPALAQTAPGRLNDAAIVAMNSEKWGPREIEVFWFCARAVSIFRKDTVLIILPGVPERAGGRCHAHRAGAGAGRNAFCPTSRVCAPRRSAGPHSARPSRANSLSMAMGFAR